jgi:predicted permease
VEAEMNDELRFHFEREVDKYEGLGLPHEEALRRARLTFGGMDQTKEECREARGVSFIETTIQDLRYAIRLILARPTFSAPALLSLALGIGGNIAIFSVINAVLIRPLPYVKPEKLVGVFNSAVLPGLTMRELPLTLDLYSAYKEKVGSFEEFGVWTSDSASVTRAGAPEQVPTVSMTSGVLRALGIKPYLGRWFLSADEYPGAQKTVILSYKYWQRKFGGDRRVLGRLILIDFVPHQVIGVMPRSFEFLNLAPDLFLAQTVVKGAPGSQDADRSGLARLKPGVSLAKANQDIAHVLSMWAAESGLQQTLSELRIKPNIHSLKQDVIGDVGAVLKTLMGALAMVLLLVCANVANLVQVRVQGRRDEFAIRAALGAGWGRIARQLVIESLALAALGGAVGLAFAYAALRLLIIHGPADLPRVGEISIDSMSIYFALASTFLSGVLFGSIAVIKSGFGRKLQKARGATQNTEQSRAQNALVIAQVALALVLLIGAGLLVRSFIALSEVAPGFTQPEHVETIRLFIPEAEVPKPEQVAQMQSDIAHAVATIPGVSAVAFGTALPLEFEYRNGNPVSVDGKTPVGRMPPNRMIKRISPGLFAALGTRLVDGRDFTWSDLLNQRRVAIISENMAREYWSEPRDALGERIQINGDQEWSAIVGVAQNVYDNGVDQQPPSLVYFPGSRRGITFAIRSSRAGTESLVKEIAAKIHATDPNLPVAQIRTLHDVYRLTMARRSFTLVLLGIAAAMAITLSIIGVYGVLAYAVVQRRKEVGIRLAIGAEPRAIKILFLRQGLILMCVGLAIGLVSARGLTQWMASLLFGVKPSDPLTYGIAGIVVIAAALAASYVPARRAAFLNPIEALRID